MLGSSPPLRSPKTPGRTRTLLRHRLGHLPRGTGTTQPSLGRIPRRVYQRIEGRRLHRRTRVGGSQELWVQNPEEQNQVQSAGLPSQQRGKNPMNYDVMHQIVLDEIQKLQKEPRQTQVVKTHQIVRDAKNYDHHTFPDYKRYQLVRQESHRSQYLPNLPLRIRSKMPRYYLIRLTNTPQDQLTDFEGDEPKMMKTNIYEETFQEIKKLFLDWFQDIKEDGKDLILEL